MHLATLLNPIVNPIIPELLIYIIICVFCKFILFCNSSICSSCGVNNPIYVRPLEEGKKNLDIK